MMEELRRRIGSEPSRALAELTAIEVGTLAGWKGPEDGLQRAGIAIEMAEGPGHCASADGDGRPRDLQGESRRSLR